MQPGGGQSEAWAASNYFRANIYEAQAVVTLAWFEVYLDLPSTGCDLGYYVYTSPSTGGPFTLVWSAMAHSADKGYHPSDPVALRTEVGTYYPLAQDVRVG